MTDRSRILAGACLAVALSIPPALPIRGDGGVEPDGAAAVIEAGRWQRVQKLLDLSGLAWLQGDVFLAVHDAKFPDEKQRVRTSLLRLPSSLEGLEWLPLRPRFPEGPSSDLESAARIPRTQKVLLLESGDDASGLDRIYLARVGPRDVDILDVVHWSSFYRSVFNVEGAAVAETGNGYLFIWAERADGEASTRVQWTDLRLAPFAIGSSGVVGSALFTLPADLVTAYNRPLVGIDVDRSGRVYAVTAFDPDSDDGPFRSAVMATGRVETGAVVLDAAPTVLSVLDGLKVESVTIRERGNTRELFVGTDDENYGGTLRPLPLGP